MKPDASEQHVPFASPRICEAVNPTNAARAFTSGSVPEASATSIADSPVIPSTELLTGLLYRSRYLGWDMHAHES